jgi:hypothetical protein
VACNAAELAWKAAGGGDWQVEPDRGFFHDADVRGDEVVILGSPGNDHYERSPGGMVWRGQLSKGLEQWEALYKSEAVAEKVRVMNLQATLGSIRYLPGGGFVVAPNFLPGVWLFSASGSLKRQWTSEELWGSAKAGAGEGVQPVREWRNWRFDREVLGRVLASRTVIDDVLPLPEGPAIVVREPRGDGARYRLGVLGPEIRWYDIPAVQASPLARLQGDVDEQGRIVLAAFQRWPQARVPSSEILVLRLPR